MCNNYFKQIKTVESIWTYFLFKIIILKTLLTFISRYFKINFEHDKYILTAMFWENYKFQSKANKLFEKQSYENNAKVQQSAVHIVFDLMFFACKVDVSF